MIVGALSDHHIDVFTLDDLGVPRGPPRCGIHISALCLDCSTGALAMFDDAALLEMCCSEFPAQNPAHFVWLPAHSESAGGGKL
jgi:hypothetical protein